MDITTNGHIKSITPQINGAIDKKHNTSPHQINHRIIETRNHHTANQEHIKAPHPRDPSQPLTQKNIITTNHHTANQLHIDVTHQIKNIKSIALWTQQTITSSIAKSPAQASNHYHSFSRTQQSNHTRNQWHNKSSHSKSMTHLSNTSNQKRIKKNSTISQKTPQINVLQQINHRTDLYTANQQHIKVTHRHDSI